MTPSTTCPECPPAGPARRSVLRQMAAAGALGSVVTTAGVGSSSRYAFATAPAAADAAPAPADVLVVLSLRGGFDGLNVVVPAGDPGYAAARPTIGIPARTLLPLAGVFGLHPAMAPLMPWWRSGDLGFVQAVGQAAPTRSHFAAMNEMERAAPGSSLRTGWLDRTLGLDAGAFAAVQMGTSQVSPAFAGPGPELSMSSIDGFELSGAWNPVESARWSAALTALHAGAPAAVAAPATATLGATSTVDSLQASGYVPAHGAAYPSGNLGEALRDVARLIKAGVGLRAAAVDHGHWDMHAGMGTVDSGWMTTQLAELAAALAAFATDLGPLLDGVTLVTMSEFGRRVHENGSGGSDHGHGNAVLLLGGGVVGGKVHGRWPGLAPSDLLDGDLTGTTDYRLVLAEILQRRCGLTTLSSVFPGLTGTPLGLVRPI